MPEGHPERESRRASINAAIRLAEEVSRGSACTSVEPAVQAIDASRGVAGGGIGCECDVAAVAAAAHSAATAWLTLNPGASDRGANRWTNTAEARSFLGRLANDTADLAALDAFTAAVEASDAAGATTPSCAGPSRIMRDFSASISALIRRLGNPSTPRPMDRSGRSKRRGPRGGGVNLRCCHLAFSRKRTVSVTAPWPS